MFLFLYIFFIYMCIVFVLNGFYCTDVSTYFLSCIFKSYFLLFCTITANSIGFFVDVLQGRQDFH